MLDLVAEDLPMGTSTGPASGSLPAEPSGSEELARAIRRAHALVGHAQARLLDLVARFQAREAYTADGARSMPDWLVAELHVARTTAYSWSRTAAYAGYARPLFEALYRGKLSLDQVEALAPCTPAGDAGEVAIAAGAWSVSQCRAYARRTRLPSIEETNEQHDHRHLSLRRRRDGCLKVSGLFTPDAGSTLEQAICDRAEQASPDPESGKFEPYAQLLADALVDLVAAGSGAVDPGRATVVVHVDAGVLAGSDRSSGASPGCQLPGEELGQGHGHGQGLAEAQSGSTLCAETARRLACDTEWQLVATDRSGQPLGVGRQRRSAPAWLRRQLYHRDGSCRFPGCDHTRLLHAHHIVHWADGGATAPGNLVLLCNRHHRFLHEEHWRLSGDPAGELRFTSPSGKSFSTFPTPRPSASTERAARSPMSRVSQDHSGSGDLGATWQDTG